MAAAALLVVLLGNRGPTGSAPLEAPASQVGATGASGGGATPGVPQAGPGVAVAPPGPGLVVMQGAAPVPSEILQRVQQQATVAVARVREVVLATCKPAVAALDRPVVFTVQVSFDASGKEVARSASSEEATLPGLETCVLVAEAGALRVDPPGVPLSTRVRLEIP